MKPYLFLIMAMKSYQDNCHWMNQRLFQHDSKYALIIGKNNGVCDEISHYNNFVNVHLNKDSKEISEKTIVMNHDMEDSVFNPETFDYIQLNIPLLNIKKKANVFYQLHRILTREGKMEIIEYEEDHPYMIELKSLESVLVKKLNIEYDSLHIVKKFFKIEESISAHHFKKFTLKKKII